MANKFKLVKGQCYYTPSFASPTMAALLVWNGEPMDHVRLENNMVFEDLKSCAKATQALIDYHIIVTENQSL